MKEFEFLKAYVRLALEYREQHDLEIPEDYDALYEALFGSFVGQKVIEVYYQMIGTPVYTTQGGDIWHQDQVFDDAIAVVRGQGRVEGHIDRTQVTRIITEVMEGLKVASDSSDVKQALETAHANILRRLV